MNTVCLLTRCDRRHLEEVGSRSIWRHVRLSPGGERTRHRRQERPRGRHVRGHDLAAATRIYRPSQLARVQQQVLHLQNMSVNNILTLIDLRTGLMLCWLDVGYLDVMYLSTHLGLIHMSPSALFSLLSPVHLLPVMQKATTIWHAYQIHLRIEFICHLNSQKHMISNSEHIIARWAQMGSQ